MSGEINKIQGDANLAGLLKSVEKAGGPIADAFKKIDIGGLLAKGVENVGGPISGAVSAETVGKIAKNIKDNLPDIQPPKVQTGGTLSEWAAKEREITMNPEEAQRDIFKEWVEAERNPEKGGIEYLKDE